MRNAEVLQLRFDELQMSLVPSCKSNGERVFGEIPWAALAGSMDELRSKNAPREISPQDAVVMERPTGIEPAGPWLLIPGPHPNGQTRIYLCQERPEKPATGFLGASWEGGGGDSLPAGQTVKLVLACHRL